jgi:hypothetical protein
MKISKIILIAAVFLTGFMSCKKDKAEQSTSIEGR